MRKRGRYGVFDKSGTPAFNWGCRIPRGENYSAAVTVDLAVDFDMSKRKASLTRCCSSSSACSRADGRIFILAGRDIDRRNAQVSNPDSSVLQVAHVLDKLFKAAG